jgi:hypothetical protein
MPKKTNNKGARKVAKPSAEPISYASFYGALLAKQVAAVLTPQRTKPKPTKKTRA